VSEEVDPRLLARLRAPHPVPPGARERVRGRLAAVVPGMSGGGGGHGGGSSGHGAPPAGGAGLLSGVVSGPTALIAAFLVGGAGGYALHAAVAKPAPPSVVYVDRVVPAASVPPSSMASVAPPPAAPEASTAAKAVTVRATPSASATSQLQAERELLDEARAGLVAGEPSRALDRLEQHRRRFLNPLLAEERDAMWVEALAQAGRLDDARQRAAAFHRTYPQSLFLPTIDSAVGNENP